MWGGKKVLVTEVLMSSTTTPIYHDTPWQEIWQHTETRAILGDLKPVGGGAARATLGITESQMQSVGVTPDWLSPHQSP